MPCDDIEALIGEHDNVYGWEVIADVSKPSARSRRLKPSALSEAAFTSVTTPIQ